MRRAFVRRYVRFSGRGGTSMGVRCRTTTPNPRNSLIFFRIVCDQVDGSDSKFLEHQRRNRVIPFIRLVSKLHVGFNGIEAFILQIVGAKLVREPNAAPLLTEIKDDAPTSVQRSSPWHVRAARRNRSAKIPAHRL